MIDSESPERTSINVKNNKQDMKNYDEMQLNLSPTYPQTMQKASILNNNQTTEIKELKKFDVKDQQRQKQMGKKTFGKTDQVRKEKEHTNKWEHNY